MDPDCESTVVNSSRPYGSHSRLASARRQSWATIQRTVFWF